MSQHNVLTDESKLSKIDQKFYKFESSITLVSGFIILFMVMLSVVNILGRWLFSLPINGYIDWIEQSMPFFAFLGVSFVQRSGSHIRMDMLIGKLKTRALWVVESLSLLAILTITIILTYGTYLHFFRAYTLGDSTLDIDLPVWPSKLIIPIAFTILIIRLLIQLWGFFRAIKTNGAKIIAVPLIENAKKAAIQEIKSIE